VEPCLLWFLFANIVAGGRAAKWLHGSFILFLGSVSYSFYLTHGLILFLLSRSIDHHTDFAKLSGGQFFCFVLGGYFLAVLFASVVFRWVEYPFLTDSRAARN
jgi:peptidoglycan/LPS O-acetylase OafA/YrhL